MFDKILKDCTERLYYQVRNTVLNISHCHQKQVVSSECCLFKSPKKSLQGHVCFFEFIVKERVIQLERHNLLITPAINPCTKHIGDPQLWQHAWEQLIAFSMFTTQLCHWYVADWTKHFVSDSFRRVSTHELSTVIFCLQSHDQWYEALNLQQVLISDLLELHKVRLQTAYFPVNFHVSLGLLS